jgi:hypothetical protein
MSTVSVKSPRSKLHKSAARVITQSFDAVSREKREINDKVLRKTLLRAQSASEEREMQKVLASPSDSLFAIDPAVGFTSFDWPKEDSKLVKQAIKNTQKIRDQDTWEGKSYFRSMKSLKDYALDSPEMQLATSEAMLKSVAQYLGQLPMLLDISASISLSDPDRPGAALSGSQMFHRDMDDISSVKVWILCSDVKSENGPTVLLPTKLSHAVAKKINYKQGDKIPNDLPFAEHEKDLFEAVGPVGTSFATDTCSSFHYGSRTEVSKERLVLYFQYVTSTSVYFRPLGERAGDRSRKFFTVPQPENLTSAQRTLLRGYL